MCADATAADESRGGPDRVVGNGAQGGGHGMMVVDGLFHCS